MSARSMAGSFCNHFCNRSGARIAVRGWSQGTRHISASSYRRDARRSARGGVCGEWGAAVRGIQCAGAWWREAGWWHARARRPCRQHCRLTLATAVPVHGFCRLTSAARARAHAFRILSAVLRATARPDPHGACFQTSQACFAVSDAFQVPGTAVQAIPQPLMTSCTHTCKQ